MSKFMNRSLIETSIGHLASLFVVATCRIDPLVAFGHTDSHVASEACEGQDKDFAYCTVADSIRLYDLYQDYTLLASPGFASDDTRMASSTYGAYYYLANNSFHSPCVS